MIISRLDPEIVTVQIEWEDSIIRTPLLQDNAPKEISEKVDYSRIQFNDKNFQTDEYISK